MAAGRHLGFIKMLITSAWIELFGWNLNCVYFGITEIGKFNQKCEILKIQDGGRPPSWIYQMLITSAWIELFGWNLNCIYLGITEIGKIHQKCEILKIQDGGRPPSWIFKNVTYFHMNETILSTFQQHTPASKRCRSLGSKCKIVKSKMAATAGLKSIDVILQQKSAEDASQTKAIDGKIRFQLLLPFRRPTVTTASASPW